MKTNNLYVEGIVGNSTFQSFIISDCWPGLTIRIVPYRPGQHANSETDDQSGPEACKLKTAYVNFGLISYQFISKMSQK